MIKIVSFLLPAGHNEKWVKMIKRMFVVAIIILPGENTFAQKYFRIEGTKKIFMSYNNYKVSNEISDSVTISFYVEKGFFYLGVKLMNAPLKPYIKYNISNEIDKVKVKSIARGGGIAGTKVIDVSIIKAEEVSADSQFIEEILK